MDVSAIRTKLADVVRDRIPRLNCFGFMPGAIPEPAFVVGEVEILFDLAMGRGLDQLDIVCRLLVSRADDQAGQEALDRYLAGSGEDSVKAALVAARGAPGEMALDGLAHDLQVPSVNGYGFHELGDTVYFGAAMTVRVYGKG